MSMNSRSSSIVVLQDRVRWHGARRKPCASPVVKAGQLEGFPFLAVTEKEQGQLARFGV